MDINKWKSVAIDVDTYAIVKAMGKQDLEAQEL